MDIDTADVSNKLIIIEEGLNIKDEKLEDDDAVQPKINMEQILKDCIKQQSPPAVYTPESSNSSQEDSNSLKRKQPPQDELVNKKARVASIKEVDEYDSLTEQAKYFMITSSALSSEIIKKYLQEHDVTIEDKSGSVTEKRLIRLKFQNAADGRNILKNLYEQGRKAYNLSPKKLISLRLIDTTLVATRVSPKELENVDDKASTSTELSLSLFEPEEDDGGPLGLYGLKPEFLKALGITPPLNKWVTVTNVRCDKFELRDVMEMAGKVLSCSFTNVLKKIVKVQYSHPLEAVQAISMFNQQMFFGVKLEVCMDDVLKNEIILPNGLYNIGPGLGLYGKPIRDIAEQYKYFSSQQKCSLNPKMFCKTIYDVDNVKDEKEIDINEFRASPANDRTFIIRSVEDMDSNDKDQSEKRHKTSKSATSDGGCSDSNNETEKTMKSKDTQIKNPTINRNNSQPDMSGSFPRPNIPQNVSVRSQMFPSAPFRPPRPQAQFLAPFRPGPPCNPNNMPNNMMNQQHSYSFGTPQPYRPQPPRPNISGNVQSSMGSGQFRPNAPGLVRTGPVPIRGPGSVPGPRPIRGPGSVPGPEPIRGAGSVPGPGSIRGPVPMPGPGLGPIRPPEKMTLQFTNLPPSTTFSSFCEKLSRCGQVMSLQFTTPGCAVATFGHQAHAARCLQMYNGMTVQGFRIIVTFI